METLPEALKRVLGVKSLELTLRGKSLVLTHSTPLVRSYVTATSAETRTMTRSHRGELRTLKSAGNKATNLSRGDYCRETPTKPVCGKCGSRLELDENSGRPYWVCRKCNRWDEADRGEVSE